MHCWDRLLAHICFHSYGQIVLYRAAPVSAHYFQWHVEGPYPSVTLIAALTLFCVQLLRVMDLLLPYIHNNSDLTLNTVQFELCSLDI